MLYLDDFQHFVGQDFHRDDKIQLNIENPLCPSFSRWIWTDEIGNSSISVTWSALIGGDIVGTEESGDIFNELPILINRVLSLIHGVPSLINGVLRLINGAKSLIHGVLSLINGVPSLINGAKSLIHGAKSLIHGVLSLINGAKSLINGVLSLINGAKSLINAYQR